MTTLKLLTGGFAAIWDWLSNRWVRRLPRATRPTEGCVEAFRWTGGIDQKGDPPWIVEAMERGDVWIDNGGPLGTLMMRIAVQTVKKPEGTVARSRPSVGANSNCWKSPAGRPDGSRRAVTVRTAFKGDYVVLHVDGEIRTYSRREYARYLSDGLDWCASA